MVSSCISTRSAANPNPRPPPPPLLMPVGGPKGGPSGAPPSRRSKGRIHCTVEGPRESASVAAESEPFDIASFKEGLDIKILECSEECVVLQLRGCDASLANAIRRILISEVPTVALETIQNTGVVQDEVLAHRLGLIPFRVNPDKLAFRSPTQELGEENSLKMQLHVKCTAADLQQPHQKSMPGAFFWGFSSFCSRIWGGGEVVMGGDS
ncbi:hypothetical protein ACSSS7_002308 [Eimeria intestinalis]